MRDTHASDPKILKIIQQSLEKEEELILSPEVYNMLEFVSNEFVESDSDSD